MSVTFECETKYYQIMRSAVMTAKYNRDTNGDVSVSCDAVDLPKDSDFIFQEGENHDQLTLTDQEEIEAMRRFIKGRYYIKELVSES